MDNVQASLSVEKRSEFERIYQVFDANSDGYLTQQEITEALEILGQAIAPSDRANLFDRLVDDVVTHESFIEWMAHWQDLDVTADLRQIFNLIDVDGSGHLSFDEFTQVVRCLNTHASDAEIEAFVRQADTSGDGQIDFEEFIATQASGSKLQMTAAAIRSFEKILVQYAKVADVSSIALVEVDSDLGTGKRGASKGIDFLKNAAIAKQSARMRAENGVVSLDNRAVQNENHALKGSKVFTHAKYIDAIYKVLARTTDVVAQTLEDGLFPVVLGGDQLMLRHRRLMANYDEFVTYFLPIDADDDDLISLSEMNVAMTSVGEAQLSVQEADVIKDRIGDRPLTWNRFIEMLLVT